MQRLQPPGWKAPSGYANGIAAEGRMVFVAGQVGWDENCEFVSDDFAEQVGQTLKNTVAILREAGAGPEHIVRMTWFVPDKQEYLAQIREVGAAYRAVIGKHYPAMTLVEVKSLLAGRARVEIETTAVIPV